MTPSAAANTPAPSRARFLALALAYAAVVLWCLATLWSAGDLSLGRKPWDNLVKTAAEFSRPSFVDLWLGPERLEYRSDDGSLLRVENRREVEGRYLWGLLRATGTTLQIATLGSLLAAVLALPLGLLAARNLHAPRALAGAALALLNGLRAIHTLVFGLLLVGIVGLGPMAGILAIALHSAGSWGKLLTEAVETLDMRGIDAVRATGAGPLQVFAHAVWPAVLPQLVSNHLYVWEFNIRDSTVLGLIGAGGLGLLISEATALFQWGRLATVMMVVVAMVVVFDGLSRRVRQSLL